VRLRGKVYELSASFASLLASVGLGNAGLSFHCLRHTFVSQQAESGTPQAVAMELTGHDSKQMNEHYTSVELSAMRAAVAKIPRLI